MIKKILITGGIGAGKSTVSKILRQKGYLVWDADEFSRLVLFEPEIECQIKQLFGDQIFTAKGILNRDLVRQSVFKNPIQKKQLESILHPAIAQLFQKRLDLLASFQSPCWVFYEASLVIETNRHKEFDHCILVTSDVSLRKNRLLKHRSLSEDDIQKIMASQMTDEEKMPYVQFVIPNNGNEKELWLAVESMIGDLSCPTH